MSCTDIVQVIVCQLIATNVALGIDHRVGIELAVVQDVLTAIAQIGIEHTLELNTHCIAPLRLLGIVEHIGLRRAFHLRLCHPFGVVLVGHLGESQTAIDKEAVEQDVAGLAIDGVAVLHTIETAVANGDVVDVGALFQTDNQHTIAGLLTGDVLHEHVSDSRVVASAAVLLGLVIQIDF